MDESRFGVRRGEHLPADKVLQYLQAFVEENGLADCVRCNARVQVIERAEDGWKLLVKNTKPQPTEHTTEIHTSKLIVAVGLTNQPFMPRYQRSPNFEAPVIHSTNFASRYSEITKEGNHTLIIGSGKSAWDIAYACATQPKATATMLIRPSGNGPVWTAPSHVTPLGLWLEKLVFTRFIGYFSPCPWAATTGVEGWLRSFFHGTWLGRKVMHAFWGILGDDVIQLNKLNEHSETKKLRPWRDAFETGNALSILNYPTNWFDLVREGRIKIIIDDIDQLGDGKEVRLQSGQTLQVDAIVCATGWETGGNVQFKPEGLREQFGMPTTQPPDIEEVALIKKVEAELYERFPYLKTRDTSRVHHPDPSLRYAPTATPSQQPYRLYRFMVPPAHLQDRSIGFAGALMCLGGTPCAYLQALWLTAYLDGTLQLPQVDDERIKHDVYRDTQHFVLRNAAGYGSVYPDLVFDSLPYFDALMQDLGFQAKRKGGLWVAEAFNSYGPEDYEGLVEEWKNRMVGGISEKKDN